MILDKFNLQGKVAIVTGASRGLGQGMACALAEAGADVVGVGISDSAATGSAVEQAGGRYLAIKADLTDSSGVDDIVAQAVAAFGRVDILINNAGTIRRNDLLAFTET